MSEQAGSNMDRPHEYRDAAENGNKRLRLNVLEAKHKIFLSHSGAQKSFVDDLYVDLVRRDRHAFFDKCRSSLPVGEPFPKLIFDAIEQCAVGVVVLSEEFFTKTKWPMLELVAMVKEYKKRNGRIIIIPVFYKITRQKCLNITKQTEWVRKYWKKWEEEDNDSRIHVEEWKEALRIFGSTTGVIMKKGVLDGELRTEIVKAVCKKVPPETRWDDSHVHGRTHLYEEIRKKIYGGLKPKDLKGELQVVGLYGMGGMGKTTACKVLCNALSRDYDDKVCHAEFGNGSKLKFLKKMLKPFTNLDDDYLKSLGDVELCESYLKKRKLEEGVFLALDNVSGDTTEQAKTLLSTNYGRGSVVVVTARSMDVLLCVGVEKKNCFAMPELEYEEAEALFLSHVGWTEYEVDSELLEKCMERCYFSKGESSSSWYSDGEMHYHPLALKVLGNEVGDALRRYGWERREKLLTGIENFNMSRQKVHPVFSILRSSFDSLRDEDQLLFLHIALFLPDEDYYGIRAMKWLEMVHGEKVYGLESRFESLKEKSLLESFGMTKDDFKMHDLWREFAEAEIKMERFADRVFLNDDYGRRDRMRRFADQVFLDEDYGRRGRLDLTGFPKMGVVKVEFGGDGVLDLQGLNNLKSLDVYYYCMEAITVEVKGLGSLKNLTFLRSHYALSSECLGELGRLTELKHVQLVGFKGDTLPDLSKLTNLRILVLNRSHLLRSISLRNLPSLEELHLECCGSLQSMDISGCTAMTKIDLCMMDSKLEDVNVSKCPLLVNVDFLWELGELRKLDISGCSSIIALNQVFLKWKLEELRARNCDSLAILPTYRLPKLRFLDIEPSKIPAGFGMAPL